MSQIKKKKILIDATGSSGWIGGVYHKKNIVFSLIQNHWIRENCQLVIVTNQELIHIFEEFRDEVKISSISYRGIREKKIKLTLIALMNRCRYVFPNHDNRICHLFRLVGINWVPDYQHYHFEEFFSFEELESRKKVDKDICASNYPLVLSSNACLDDFKEYCTPSKKDVYVVPFVSYIEKEVRDITESDIKKVCDDHGTIPGEYIMVANQFWQHKNHRVVLEAVRILAAHFNEKIKIVFTGQLSDCRDDAYVDTIREMLSDPVVSNMCVCTGFIDRKEQLALMIGAKFIIQPSLFEGWGTVLEDAKVLDKSVILSDIPVHREQMNDKCRLFDPSDANELAEMINDQWKKNIVDDYEQGIRRMYKEAVEYSVGFEKLLRVC